MKGFNVPLLVTGGACQYPMQLQKELLLHGVPLFAMQPYLLRKSHHVNSVLALAGRRRVHEEQRGAVLDVRDGGAGGRGRGTARRDPALPHHPRVLRLLRAGPPAKCEPLQLSPHSWSLVLKRFTPGLVACPSTTPARYCVTR